MGFYRFDRQDAFNFASHIGARTKVVGDELVFRICPYCKADGRNDQKKFAINLTNGTFNCFRASCGAKGNMLTLAKDFGFSLGNNVDTYYGLNEGKRYRTYHLEHIVSKDKAVEYCKHRGISEEVCKRYELTVQNEHENVLVMPFRDDNDVVSFIKYRDTEYSKEKGGNKEWCERDGKPILFGMNHATEYDKPLVVTEGQMDSLSVATAGVPNAVSVPTGAKGETWIPHCWDWLGKFKEVVVFGDCEKGHITLVEMFKDRFKGLVRVVREEDYKGCKDANEILQTYGEESVRSAVDNAALIPVAQIRRLSDVERVNILDMDAIKTGITELDSVLTKGLFYGQVILLTGQRGDGKSTFMEQIVCNAVNSNVKSFIYSGELPNYVIRNFADTMFAGVHESELRHEMTERISAWYSDKLFVYDSSIIEADEHAELLDIVTSAITQYGCRLICIDNLMTVVESENNDTLYRAQSQFVGRLAKMAKVYNVVIILVAHPRKQAADAQFTNDAVSGSSDITNKVDVVISYQRIKSRKGEPVDDSMRELWITKNRLTGKLAMNDTAIPVKYDSRSRRITGKDQSFNYKCGWDSVYEVDDFEDATNIELPFG